MTRGCWEGSRRLRLSIASFVMVSEDWESGCPGHSKAYVT